MDGYSGVRKLPLDEDKQGGQAQVSESPSSKRRSHQGAFKLGLNPAREDAFRRGTLGRLQSEDATAFKRLDGRLHHLRQEQEAGPLHRG